MRWELLFADLSAELEAAGDIELQADLADQTRSQRARLRLVDRLRGSADQPLVLRVLGAGVIAGTLRGVGPDWCLLRSAGTDHLVRLGAVLEVRGLAPYSAAPGSEGVVAARFTLAAVVRRLARDRAVVTVIQVDGHLVTGTVEMAGADLLEMSERRADEPGWSSPAPADRRTLPFDSVAAVRQRGDVG